MKKPTQTTSIRSIANRLLATLCSLRIAVAILILMAVVSALGTMVPEGKDPAFYTGVYGEFAGSLILRLSLDNLFHSWWFELLFAWLLVSMTACSARQMVRMYRGRNNDRSGVLSPSRGCEGVVCLKKTAAGDGLVSALDLVKSWLTRHHFRCRDESESSGNTVLFAEHGRWGRGGALIIHVGVVAVLLGASISRLSGTTDKVLVFPDEIAQVPNTPLSVTLDDFVITYYEDEAQVKEYRSTVTVSSESGATQSGVIKVNQPLKIDGYNVYQMNFRTDAESVQVRAVRNEDEKDMGVFSLPMYTNVWIEELGISLEATQFQPDFVIQKGKAGSRSEHLVNPAVHLVWNAAKETGEKWIFTDMPSLPSHSSSAALPYSFQLDDCELSYISGLKVVRDGGKPVVYLGFIITLIGSFVSCYVFHRRIRFELSQGADGVNIRYAGAASRNALDLEYQLVQFREFIENSESVMGPAESTRGKE